MYGRPADTAAVAVPPGRPPRPRRPPIYSPVVRPRSRRAAAAASPRCRSRARALPSLHRRRRRRRRVLRVIHHPLLRERFARRSRERGNDGRCRADLSCCLLYIFIGVVVDTIVFRCCIDSGVCFNSNIFPGTDSGKKNHGSSGTACVRAEHERKRAEKRQRTGEKRDAG